MWAKYFLRPRSCVFLSVLRAANRIYFSFRRTKRARLTDQFLDGPADLGCGDCQPGKRFERDKVTKLAEYERHGVREYWILDHLEQETFFYQTGRAGQVSARSCG